MPREDAMAESQEELLDVFDAKGAVIGARPRGEAKASGLPVGAVNLLLTGAEGRVLLQRRPADKENGGRWDKSVGGHVGAGETFEETMAREAAEELFDQPGTPRVRLASSETEYARWIDEGRARDGIVARRVGLRLNLRDVRAAPGGGLRTAVYHVAVFRGRTDLALDAFRPQAAEVEELRFFAPGEIDELLLEGRLAPNMAYLWLTEAQELLADLRGEPR
jgi:isopentenyldiphosphate isomerase